MDRLLTLVRLVHRWIPTRVRVLVVDGGYAAVKLALICTGTPNTILVMRFSDAGQAVRATATSPLVRAP
ncbi:MAG: hypothetical protein ACKV2V_06175 [Blastocatellia bacterium]